MKRQRNNMQVWTSAELAIYNAIREVNKMPAHVKLTDAVILLSKAQNAVADYLKEDIQPVLRWVSARKRFPEDDGYDEPTKYVARFKGDDPHSGWVDIALMTREEMQKENYDCYWEWLEEVEQPVPSIENYGEPERGINIISPTAEQGASPVASHSVCVQNTIEQEELPFITGRLYRPFGHFLYINKNAPNNKRYYVFNNCGKLESVEVGSEISKKVFWAVGVIEQLSKSKGEPVIDNLRDKFFKECTECKYEDFRITKVNMAPHDLFEWFKPYLKSNSEPVIDNYADYELNTGKKENYPKVATLKSKGGPVIDWEGLEETFFYVPEFSNYTANEREFLFNWLKSNLSNYIK